MSHRRRAALALSVAVATGALLQVLSPARASERRAAAINVKVMTFNIRFDFDTDGENRWRYRADLVAECVKESKVTVVCFQEDKPEQVSDLKERMKEWEFVGRGRNENGTGEHCSVAYDPSVWNCVENGDFWLSDTPEKPGSITWGTKYPHKVTWARLESRKDGKSQVLFTSTHLDETKEGLEARKKSATCIRTWLSKHTTKKDNVIACGDFNSGADEEAHAIMIADEPGTKLQDVWDVIKPSEPRPGTDHDFTGIGKKKRIDWILYAGNLTPTDIKIDRYSKNGKWPSDHFAVKADLELVPPQSASSSSSKTPKEEPQVK